MTSRVPFPLHVFANTLSPFCLVHQRLPHAKDSPTSLHPFPPMFLLGPAGKVGVMYPLGGKGSRLGAPGEVASPGGGPPALPSAFR